MGSPERGAGAQRLRGFPSLWAPLKGELPLRKALLASRRILSFIFPAVFVPGRSFDSGAERLRSGWQGGIEGFDARLWLALARGSCQRS